MDQTRPPAQWRPDAKTRAQAKEARARHPLSGLIKAVYRRVPRLRPFCLKLCDRLEGGQYFSVTWRQILAEMHGAQVGRYTYGPVLRPGCVPRGSTVGAYCSIAPGLVIRRRDHPIERPALHAFFYNAALGLLTRDTIQLDQENPLEIGHDVWIGDGVTILSGCKRVGNGAVLAAGCVVTKDVAPYTIVGGVPAKPLKVRFSDEEIARIEASRWWERDIADLAGDPAFTEITGVPEDFGQGWG